MDKWVIRTPCPAPGSEPKASPTTGPAPTSRPRSSRHASSKPPVSRHASSQPPSSQASSPRPSSPPRKKYKVEVLIPRLVNDPPKFEPLSLLPTHDTTAYIKEKMLLKSAGLAADGNPLPMNLGYLIGWTDLRAASMVIPAGDVLDYVSPYALEQFEYKDWQRRKQEEKEAHERLMRKIEAKKAALESGKAAQVKKKPGRKRRGRPRKKMEVPVDEGVIQEEVRKRAGSQVREEPSLSTPKKGMFTGMASGEAEDIFEQLYGATGVESSETSYPVTSREESREHDSEPPRKRLRSSVSPTKEAGFGGGFVSGISPTPRAHLPMRESLQSPLKAEEASPTLTGFTPILPPKGARHTPITTTSSQSRDPSASPKRSTKPKKTRTPAKTPTPRSSTPKRQNGATKKAQAEEEPDELVDVQYDVKCLEGMDEMMIDGKRERFFLVRWEGNWAPEENPTWEPEDNIPRKLVRKYLAKNPPGSTTKKKKLMEKPERRYSSVTEAFEDFGPEEANENNRVVGDSQEEDDGEETFQITEGEGAGAQGAGTQLLNKTLGFAFGRWR